jgi:hypothetical protein
MRTMLKTGITGTLAVVLLGTVFVSKATADCGYFDGHRTAVPIPQSWTGSAPSTSGSLLLVTTQEGSDDRIVGFWKFKFVSEGNSGIPDGTVIDNGFAQWHSDGTEIINSSRPPATGNFCLGVWQKSGPSSYAVNHFALGTDPNGNPLGPAQIREDVTLDHKATHYEGTFALEQLDVSGNLVAHITGRVIGTRITLNTTLADVL